jgi:hypothetical protein
MRSKRPRSKRCRQPDYATLPVSALAVTAGDIDAAGRRVVQPGAYQVQVEDLTADFSVTG